MIEEWKDIPGYEGFYQASSLGRIRGVAGRVTHSTRHGERVWVERIIKPKGTATRASSGYRVALWKNKKPYDYLVARLVATTFHENLISTNLTVNHKDGNRLNNEIGNLEWMTLGDNIRHGMKNGMYPCHVTTLEDENGAILEFQSVSNAARFVKRSTNYITDHYKAGEPIVSSTGEVFRVISIKGRGL